jgi:hypothetical protein
MDSARESERRTRTVVFALIVCQSIYFECYLPGSVIEKPSHIQLTESVFRFLLRVVQLTTVGLSTTLVVCLLFFRRE